MDAPPHPPVGERTSRRRTSFARADRPARQPQPARDGRTDFSQDEVVLLDGAGRPIGTAPKSEVHGTDTPLHLACSVYVVDERGRVLITRRASAKRTFPDAWTNSCCGHPRPGEPIEDAVRRHLAGELGLRALDLTCVLPDFAYRAVAADGLVEHEVCPVYLARVAHDPRPDAREVGAWEWVAWDALVTRARERPESLSPWSVTQITRLAAMAPQLSDLAGRPRPPVRLRTPSSDDPFTAASSVEPALDAFLADRFAEAVALDGLAGELVDGVTGLVRAGGKRVRPAFVCWGFRAAGHGDADPAAPAAGAVELLHTFALIHDDVMDGATRRRGRDAVHVAFAGVDTDRTAARWTPAYRRRFGESAAVLAGDLAFAWAHQMLDHALDQAADRDVALDRPAARAAFGTLCNEVVVGQYLDLRLANAECDDAQAATIALLKSGRYTVTRPLELGAAVGGADAATVGLLREYGDAAGVAFQLRDDVLGVFGDEAIAGKSCSDDLRDGKASLLLVRAMELAPPAGRELLRRHLGDAGMEPADADRCREVVLASGALASIERLIDAKRAVAHEAARGLDDPVADALHHLAVAMVERAA